MSKVECNRLSPLPAKPDGDQAQVEAPAIVVEVGQWYWVKSERRKDGEDEEFEWLGCVMRIGSNHVKLESPSTQATGRYSTRVHFDDFWEILRHEPNAEAVIQGEIAHYQQLANQHLAEVKAITARLGVSGQPSLPDKAGESSGGALVALSGQRDIKQYERALVLAKEKQLPELFKAIEHANKELTRWMTANTLPLQASVGGMKGVIEDINDRIFNVSLYAGLTEEVVSCCDGAPAAYHEKLHVMQRRLYMDEECLMGYRHGGMDFRSIGEFDAWISQPENRDRIMPFPRTLVALRERIAVLGGEPVPFGGLRIVRLAAGALPQQIAHHVLGVVVAPFGDTAEPFQRFSGVFIEAVFPHAIAPAQTLLGMAVAQAGGLMQIQHGLHRPAHFC